MNRFKDPRTTIWQFFDTVDVQCPSCSRKGTVRNTGTPGDIFSERRFTCPSCGMNKGWHGKSVTRPEGRDPYFHYSLWFQVSCAGQTLFAVNEEHLLFLEEYVSAGIRERGEENGEKLLNRNRTMASRLPQWIKRKENREKILRAIARLKSDDFRPTIAA